jgi:sulfite oxidase
MKIFTSYFHSNSKLACVAAGMLSIWQPYMKSKHCDENAIKETDNLPIYTKNEVSKRNNINNRIWVTRGEYVYDITDWIPNHPGGQEKIMLAAGSRLEPYWQIYQQHYNSKLPLQLLETMRIGRLAPSELNDSSDNGKLNDPYTNDPESSAILIYHQRKPVNAEPPKSILSDQYITPSDLWFIRNHHPVPVIDEHSYKFDINFDETLESLTLSDLKSRYRKHHVTSTIQCGGNRRKEMNNISLTNGSPWDIGAIATATWSGAKLSEVLKSLGLNAEVIEKNKYKHVHFYSVDGVEVSIPLKKALDDDSDTLLAYEMNGEPIPTIHGYPVRVVIPGYVGVRNLKWLSKIVVSEDEASGPWQRGMAYKGFSPSVKSLEGIDTSKVAPKYYHFPVFLKND